MPAVVVCKCKPHTVSDPYLHTHIRIRRTHAQYHHHWSDGRYKNTTATGSRLQLPADKPGDKDSVFWSGGKLQLQPRLWTMGKIDRGNLWDWMIDENGAIQVIWLRRICFSKTYFTLSTNHVVLTWVKQVICHSWVVTCQNLYFVAYWNDPSKTHFIQESHQNSFHPIFSNN